MTLVPSLLAVRRVAQTTVLALLGGTLLSVPSALLQPAAAADVTAGLVLRYDLTQTSGTVVADTSGNANNGTLVNGGTWTGGQGLTLDGVNDFVRLPNNIMAGLSAITVSLDVFVESSQATPFFLWGLGNPATSASGTGYLMASGNGFRAAATPGNWSGEKVTQPSPTRNLARGVWKTVTYTQTGTTGTLYEDGAQVGQNTAVTVLPSQIGGGTTTNNVLGESNYATDNSLKGKVKNFRIYNRALTASEVASISLTDANRVDGDVAALSLGDLSAVTANLTLPTSGAFGSTVSWASSDPARIAANGTVVRPGPTAPAAEVTLTATVTRGLGEPDEDLHRDRAAGGGRPGEGRRGRRGALPRAPRRRPRQPDPPGDQQLRLHRGVGLLRPGRGLHRRSGRPARARRRRQHRHPDRDGHDRLGHRDPRVPADRARAARGRAVHRLRVQLLHRQLDRRREDLLRRQPRQQRRPLGRGQRGQPGPRVDQGRDGAA